MMRLQWNLHAEADPDTNLLRSLLIPLDVEDDPHANLLQLLLIPLDVEDDHGKLLQKPPLLLCQEKRKRVSFNLKPKILHQRLQR